MSNIGERLDGLKEKIQDQDFLESKGLSNEINIQIFTYDPEDEMSVRYFINNLKDDSTLKCNPKIFDLYDVFLDILRDKNIIDKVSTLEEKKGSDFVLKQLQSIATVDKYVDKMDYGQREPGDVMILTGVGEVYPFMRVHTLLEAMQSSFNDVPLLVMYPGTYDGSYLKLFNILEPNSYYRAFNIIQ